MDIIITTILALLLVGVSQWTHEQTCITAIARVEHGTHSVQQMREYMLLRGIVLSLLMLGIGSFVVGMFVALALAMLTMVLCALRVVRSERAFEDTRRHTRLRNVFGS